MKRLILILGMVLLPILSNAADVPMEWKASPGATGYKIYKSEDMGVTWDAGIDVGNVTTYTYLNVREDKLILFRASAYNAVGESIRSWSGAWYNHLWRPVNPVSGAGIL